MTIKTMFCKREKVQVLNMIITVTGVATVEINLTLLDDLGFVKVLFMLNIDKCFI